MPYDNQTSQQAFSPRPAYTRGSKCPSPWLPTRTTGLEVHLRRARMAGVRRHWRLAKRLSPSIKASDLRGWFIDAFDDGHVPTSPLKRILWLIEVRARHRRSANTLASLRIDAAIWREIQRLKAGEPPLNNQTEKYSFFDENIPSFPD